jgi:Undecaprenyl-phosphate galactose phosphotransferase WbaP
MLETVSKNLEVDFSALDNLFGERVVSRAPLVVDVIENPAAPAVGFTERVGIGAEEAAALPIEEDWRAHDLGSLTTLFRRSAATTMPFLLADLLALSLSGLLPLLGLRLFHVAVESAPWTAMVALLPFILAYWLTDLYSELWVHPVIEFRQLTRVTTVGLLAGAAIGAMAPPIPLWCAMAWPAAVMLVPLFRTIVRHCCVNRSWWGYPTLIIGSGEGAAALARMLLDCPRSALKPVLMTDPEGVCRASLLPVVNDAKMLESVLRTEEIQHAVVSLPDFSAARLTHTLDRYSALVPHLLVLSDTATLPTLWGASRNGGRLSGIEVRNGLLMVTLQGMKRVVDVVVALAVLCGALPLFVAIAVLIKLTSQGPIFYGQKRIGRQGKLFKAWKFRTMRPNADAVLLAYLQRVASAREEWSRDFKLRCDPRVTWCGGFLRKFSLDELPQIWNVLRGEMSLVGPRPIVQGEVARYGNVFKLYTTVKPGITGLWQVSGRSDISYEDRVLLDRFYIRHWSPWLDVYILAKTVAALVNRDGAY